MATIKPTQFDIMKKSPSKIFKKYNLHDSTLEDIEIKPSFSYGRKKAQIILKFSNYHGKKVKLVFKDCKNIQLSIDFDILKDNSVSGNTSHTEATKKPNNILRLIQNIEKLLNIEYQNMESPVDKKIKKIKELNCFKIYFFGGTMEIVAKNFKMQ